MYNQAIELDIEEEKPRISSDATQVVILPSNFLEKKGETETRNRNNNGKTKREKNVNDVMSLPLFQCIRTALFRGRSLCFSTFFFIIN